MHRRLQAELAFPDAQLQDHLPLAVRSEAVAGLHGSLLDGLEAGFKHGFLQHVATRDADVDVTLPDLGTMKTSSKVMKALAVSRSEATVWKVFAISTRGT